MPLLLPSISLALPSPGHQLTIFGGGGVHVLHLPALPASKIPWISEAERARLKYSTSSMMPEKRFTGQPQPLKEFWIIAARVTGSASPSSSLIVPVTVSTALASGTPSTYTRNWLFVVSRTIATW